jgi:hypothetical protein
MRISNEGRDVTPAHIDLHKNAPFAVVSTDLIQTFRKAEAGQLPQRYRTKR